MAKVKNALGLKRPLCRAGVSGTNQDITTELQRALESAVAGACPRNAERYLIICQGVMGLESFHHWRNSRGFLSHKGGTAEDSDLLPEGLNLTEWRNKRCLKTAARSDWGRSHRQERVMKCPPNALQMLTDAHRRCTGLVYCSAAAWKGGCPGEGYLGYQGHACPGAPRVPLGKTRPEPRPMARRRAGRLGLPCGIWACRFCPWLEVD
jgi:hypothetical protein